MLNKKNINNLENHLYYFDSFPVKDNYGEGFKFTCDNENYITKGEYKDGYRKLLLNISTYGIQHYYGDISIWVNNVCGNKQICGNLGIEIPTNYKSLRTELLRPVTREEIEEFPNRWEGYKEGSLTNAFYSEQEIVNLFKKLLPEIVIGKWHICIDGCKISEKFNIKI